MNKKQKRERLAELQGEKRTVIFYEAPHKLRTTLDDLTAAFGPERSITLCRELTKLHEEIWKRRWARPRPIIPRTTPAASMFW